MSGKNTDEKEQCQPFYSRWYNHFVVIDYHPVQNNQVCGLNNFILHRDFTIVHKSLSIE